jgi:hypothetical protein
MTSMLVDIQREYGREAGARQRSLKIGADLMLWGAYMNDH